MESSVLADIVYTEVMNLRSDIFGNPLIQKVLQISHPPQLQASLVTLDAWHSFAASSRMGHNFSK